MLINRKIQPEFKNIEKINIIKARAQTLSNGVPLYTISAGKQEVVKIDLIFEAGSWFQDAGLVASSANSMLNEGTEKFSSFEIAEKLDYYGAFLLLSSDKDFASVTLISLLKYLPETIHVLEDIIKNSVFPGKEFETYIKKKEQEYIIESNKVNTLAQRKLAGVLFGDDHPYGSTVEINDFKKLKARQLLDHFNRLYNTKRCKIIVSGKVNDHVIGLINRFFGKDEWNISGDVPVKDFDIIPVEKKEYFVKKENSIQSAIRIGKTLFNKMHPDYMGMKVLNTILGGYFGSRLMTNIREDKGYTYSIGSVLVSLKNAGYLVIVSEVGKDVCKDAIMEIYYELDRLRNEPVPEDELELVRNYILGEIVRTFDGPFALAESFRSILEYDLDYGFFDTFIETVKNITSDELMDLANKYLDGSTMYEVVAGS